MITKKAAEGKFTQSDKETQDVGQARYIANARRTDIKQAAEKPQNMKEARYTKEQLTDAERYRGRKDLLAAVLSEEGRYDINTVDTLIGQFMKGKVN